MTPAERAREAIQWLAENMVHYTGESLEDSLTAVREAYNDMPRNPDSEHCI